MCARVFDIDLPVAKTPNLIETVETELRACSSCEDMAAILSRLINRLDGVCEAHVAQQVKEVLPLECK